MYSFAITFVREGEREMGIFSKMENVNEANWKSTKGQLSEHVRVRV